MDPVSLLAAALMKNPELAASAAEAVLKPGTVNVALMQSSVADLSRGVLTCYHRTAKFRQTDIVGTSWDRAWQYGAERLAVLRITFHGVCSTQYQMDRRDHGKGDAARGAVVAENTLVPYNKWCEFEEWATPK